jgi:hypothetical protein
MDRSIRPPPILLYIQLRSLPPLVSTVPLALHTLAPPSFPWFTWPSAQSAANLRWSVAYFSGYHYTPPATAGEGDHWSSRSERTVVEGAPDAELRFRCGKFSLQKKRANMFGHHKDSCGALRPAPPPPPCFAGWSPSPASRGRMICRHSGAPRSGEPGIHTRDRCRIVSETVLNVLWLWIPGSVLRTAPE